jgi:hypothetical protein
VELLLVTFPIFSIKSINEDKFMNSRSEHAANMSLVPQISEDIIHHDMLAMARQRAYEKTARSKLQYVRRHQRRTIWQAAGAILMGVFAAAVFITTCALLYPGFRASLIATFLH